jgi:hypothetical protein
MATPTTPLRVAFCVLGLLAVLGDCSFKIIVSQNDSSLKPTDFVLYFNQTVCTPHTRLALSDRYPYSHDATSRCSVRTATSP